MVRLVHVVATASAVGLLLAGCGSEESGTAETSESSAAETSSSPAAAPTSSAAVVDDHQAIREVVQAQADAFSDGDWDAMAQLTCAKYREQAKNPAAFLVPPLDRFGTRQEVASMEVAQVSEVLAQQFGGGATPATLDRIAQAIVAYDEAAYRAAMLDLLTESATLIIENVENIQVTGDTATADVTLTRVMGDAPPRTTTEPSPFVREDGRWLECSDMTPTGS